MYSNPEFARQDEIQKVEPGLRTGWCDARPDDRSGRRVPPLAAASFISMTNFIFYSNPALTLVYQSPTVPVLYSLSTAANLTGVHPEMLRYYCRLGLLDLQEDQMTGELLLDDHALKEIRRIEHYRRDLGVVRRALPLICELQKESERQNIELHFLRCP
jgi:hypothetical protein